MTLPRRIRPSEKERVFVNLRRMAGGSSGGLSRASMPTRAGLWALSRLGIFAIVFNGDDPDVARPDVLLTYWIGAAVPVNGLDFDMRYPATL